MLSVSANHSWGGYHWARSGNLFTLKIGDNVSSLWDMPLGIASSDWSQSSILDSSVVVGQTNPKICRAVSGRVEVCNSKYGNNGWLGIASVWVSGGHITQGTVKLNDTYFNTVKYNTPAWRRFVMCQEIGHTLGLDHQDVDFGNQNLGTCMDYTNDPSGTINGQLNNEHPDQHDYDQLVTIYGHLDTFSTIFSSKTSSAAVANVDSFDPSQWGRAIRKSANGRNVLHERDLGNGDKIFTFIVWVD